MSCKIAIISCKKIHGISCIACPIDLEALKAKIEEVTGKNVIIGTHNY